MIICTPIAPSGEIGHSWGRAHAVALWSVEEGDVAASETIDVGWDALHDEGKEGSHHARVARFLKDHRVEVVVASHMGAPMSNMIDKLGIRLVLGAAGNAREAAQQSTRT
ncbi:MAG: NifB/NifX family molybdenum-iron cluster-binding protein [Arachnia sp.]